MTEKTDKVIPFPTVKTYIENLVDELGASSIQSLAIIIIDKDKKVTTSYSFGDDEAYSVIGALECLKQEIMSDSIG
jgi:hypothetical protein